MQVLLLGNGFDLNHKLPTKYINFLHTVQYLVKNYTDEINSVGRVFGDEELQKADGDIEESYAQFNKVYDDVLLPKEQIQFLIDEANKNLWYKYFVECLDKELNWIDFEKEIATVIEVIARLLKDEHQTSFVLGTNNWTRVDRYIILHFSSFYEETMERVIGYGKKYSIKEKYTFEYPRGSKEIIVDNKMIIGDLYAELRKLAEMLRVYLNSFVDGLTRRLCETERFPEQEVYSKADGVYTFNYTNTFENLYGNRSLLAHIHGSTKGNIVLGINPDEKDELETMDTSFIQFKKYYQRIFYRTDHTYLESMESYKLPFVNRNEISLHVIGHSLDITDEDIIREVFESCGNITIYYYCEEDVGKYIRNLIQMYGKKAFDEMRNEKKIMFMPLGTVEWKNN